MNPILFGELECNRVPYSKALRKHVEKRVSEWISAQNFPEYPKGLSFHVRLEREGIGHTMSCQVTVASKDAWWTAHSWGRTPEDALSRTLSRMKPVASNPLQRRSRTPSPIHEPQIA